MRTVEEVQAFHKLLRETGGYRTDPARPKCASARFFGGCDWYYYLRLLRFLYQGSRMVARGEYDDPRWAAHSYEYLNILEECGAIFDVSGMEHPVRLGRSAVFIGNHMSLIEAFTLPALLLHKDRIAAVAKESLSRYPLLGPITRAVDPILVGRTNPREDLKAVLETGTDFLNKGRSVVLFPQATRSVHFDPKAFNTLGVKLAKAAGAPIIPLAVKTDFQKNGRWIKDMGGLDRSKTIHFRFGPPIAAAGSGREANAEIIRFIQEALAEWGASGT